jgi:hypothetical protein
MNLPEAVTGSNCCDNAPHVRAFLQKSAIRTKTAWPESASELYRLSDCRFSGKSVPTFADSGCHAISMTDLYVGMLGFLDWSRYFFFQVAPQLYSRG